MTFLLAQTQGDLSPSFFREDVRIERIVSTGQSTPVDKPHRQGHDEWVLLLAGFGGSPH